MFIRKIRKQNGKTSKIYECLHLVESIRTPNGPRQRLVLNLGNLDLHKSQYVAFAKRIEDILSGQKSIILPDEKLEQKAKDASRKVFRKHAEEISIKTATDFRLVDLKSIDIEDSRSYGPEYICLSFWNELGLDKILLQNGISSNFLCLIKALTIGRLVEPHSERHTKDWAEKRSSLYELIGHPINDSLNTYYRANDILFALKDKVEKHLNAKEKDLFALEEKVFFFDLTNTYLEGAALKNPKAQYGRSKEKRSDCKIVTLGLIVDSDGFSKYSKTFSGNQSEAATLVDMIKEMDGQFVANFAEKKGNDENISKTRTIVIDAGIATEENINILKDSNYNYIAVNRGKAPFERDFTDMKIIKEDALQGVKVEVKLIKHDGENYVLCRSQKKKSKEIGIRERFEKLFLEKLEYYKSGLIKKGRTKNYQLILEMIGRMKERYSKASQLYEIEVMLEKKESKNISKLKAIDIIWSKKDDLYTKKIENEGVYILRTNRDDLTSQEIWEIYVMLTRIEESFKNLKSSLGLRPVFHQKEVRADAHLFISVLAYHILHAIENRLRSKGDNRRWSTIRDIMKTHQRVTLSFNIKNENDKKVRQAIRISTKLEEEHAQIYKDLNISTSNLSKRKLLTQNQ